MIPTARGGEARTWCRRWLGSELRSQRGRATIRVESTEGCLSPQAPRPASHQFFLVSVSSPPAFPVYPGCLHLSQAACLSVPFLHQASTLCKSDPESRSGRGLRAWWSWLHPAAGPLLGTGPRGQWWGCPGLSQCLGRAWRLPRHQALGRRRPKRRPRLRASGSCRTSHGLPHSADPACLGPPCTAPLVLP